VFTRRAKRRMTSHPKFYYFDSGVFRALRPRGPLDAASEIDGSLETVLLANLRAVNDAMELGYSIHAHGERYRGLRALRGTRHARVR
jgi:hypothetical protein